MNKTECTVLLVEDSPEDTVATLRALKKAGMTSRVFHCENGDDGLDFLYHRGRYTNLSLSPRPCFVLLDLNMPGIDGREVLAEIKHDKHLSTIPVIVLTSSSDARDIENCYQLGANCYVKKAVDFDEFFRTIKCLNDFWFNVVVFPQGILNGI